MRRFSFVFAMMMALLLWGQVAFATPMKAEVGEQRLEFPSGEARYPSVRLENREAARRINDTLKKEAEEFSLRVKEDQKRNKSATGKMTYRITCNKANAFSCILEEVRSPRGDRAASVLRRKAYIFKLSSGRQAAYDDVWALAVAAGKNKLYDRKGLVDKVFNQTERAGIALSSPFRGLSYPPKNLYLDEKLRFHMLLQPGEVTDPATGSIDIDIDEENW